MLASASLHYKILWIRLNKMTAHKMESWIISMYPCSVSPSPALPCTVPALKKCLQWYFFAMGSKMKTAKIIARLTNQISVFSIVLYVSCTGNVLMDLMVEKEILLFMKRWWWFLMILLQLYQNYWSFYIVSNCFFAKLSLSEDIFCTSVVAVLCA